MLDHFRPLLEAAQGLDLTAPDTACAELERRFAATTPAADALRAKLIELYEAGSIANRGELPVQWGRVCKATAESLGFSIDVVYMNGKGPAHRHPKGEVNFCVPIDGTPSFEGQTNGWVVMPPDSRHVPEVQGGTMLITYLLPEGAMEFEK